MQAKSQAAAPAETEFKVPAYLASLIGSINDGAKGAQTGALAFAFIGLYLLAVAFSTTDEDLLRDKTIAIAQLNMPVPVVFSFAVAPIIFVFLHVYTLIRYDMLSTNLWQFDQEVRRLTDEADQDRCRHLLANVEFLRQEGARPGTPLTNWLFDVMSAFLLVVLPLAVLTIIQLSALRYQDEGIVLAQRAALVIAVFFIGWFFRRKWQLWDAGSFSVSRRVAAGALALLLVFNFAWMGVVGPAATTVGHDAVEEWLREVHNPQFAWTGSTRAAYAAVRFWWQPVDRGLCLMHFGCRYLRVPHTLLMGVSPSADMLAKLRQGTATKADLAGLEGLNLRGRTLRFVDLEDSRLYASALTDEADLRGASMSRAALTGADLSGAQLQGADLRIAQLQGAVLFGAQLQGADLSGAQLQGADLRVAQLQGADLREAQLQGADLREAKLQGAALLEAKLQGADLNNAQLQGAVLSDAQLQGAYLSDAQLQGAVLWIAQLQGADLREAKLQGADLSGAQLQGAYLSGAQLQGAYLSGARLQGADLSGAQLQGAYLSGARLQGADMRQAALWQTELDENSDLSRADLRNIEFDAVSDQERNEIIQHLQSVPDDQRDSVVNLVEERLKPGTSPAVPEPIFSIVEPALVNDALPTLWRQLGLWENVYTQVVVADQAAYDAKLAPFLAELAKTNEHVARGFVRRFPYCLSNGGECQRTLWPDLARRLLDGVEAKTITLPDEDIARLKTFLPTKQP